MAFRESRPGESGLGGATRTGADLAAQAVVGLNARLRSRVIAELLLRKLEMPALDAKTVLACAALGRALHAGDDNEAYSASICQALARTAKEESNLDQLENLVTAFAEVAKSAKPAQAEAVAMRLIQAMKEETIADRLANLAAVFAEVANGTKSGQSEAMAKLLAKAQGGNELGSAPQAGDGVCDGGQELHAGTDRGGGPAARKSDEGGNRLGSA